MCLFLFFKEVHLYYFLNYISDFNFQLYLLIFFLLWYLYFSITLSFILTSSFLSLFSFTYSYFVFTCCCWHFCWCLFLTCSLKSLSNTYLLVFCYIVTIMNPKDFMKRVLRRNSFKLISHAYLCMSLSNTRTWLKELLSKLHTFYGKVDLILFYTNERQSLVNSSGSSYRFYFLGLQRSLQTVTLAMKLKDNFSLEEKSWQTYTVQLAHIVSTKDFSFSFVEMKCHKVIMKTKWNNVYNKLKK